MNKLFAILAAALLALGPGLLNGCIFTGGGTEIPNELRGRELIAGTGKPAANAEVRLVPVGYVPGENSSASLYTARTNAEGYFTFKGTPEGQYNILASKDELRAYHDSVEVTGKPQDLAADTLDSPGALSGLVKLQPQHDPRTATVQVLGTTVFVNVGADGRFTLPGLGAGEYRLRMVTIESGYVPLFRSFVVRTGVADTLAEPLEPFFSDIPAVTGVRAVAGPGGTVVLNWNKSGSSKVEAYLIYRDSASATLPTVIPIGRTEDTVYIDTIYRKTPSNTQYPYDDKSPHAFRYRVRILDHDGAVGPSLGVVEAVSIPPTRGTASGLWKLAVGDAPFPKHTHSRAIVFKDRLWLFISSPEVANPLWSSPDGLEWSQEAAPPWVGQNLFEPIPAILRDTLWVVTFSDDNDSVNNTLWRSADGKAWSKLTQQEKLGGRFQQSMVSYLGKLWLMDGAEGRNPTAEVRSSEDGLAWTSIEPGAPFLSTQYGSVESFANALWKIGGYYQGGTLSGILKSYDGDTWEKTHTNADFTKRGQASLTTHSGILWLIGGMIQGSSEFKKDVWSSSDGVTWKEEESNAPFGPRAGQAAISFRGRLWLIGGYSSEWDISTRKNDVWYLAYP